MDEIPMLFAETVSRLLPKPPDPESFSAELLGERWSSSLQKAWAEPRYKIKLYLCKEQGHWYYCIISYQSKPFRRGHHLTISSEVHFWSVRKIVIEGESQISRNQRGYGYRNRRPLPISLQELMKWLGPMTESYVRFQIIGYFDPMTFQEIGDAMKTIELGEVFFYSMKPQLDEFLAGHLARYGVETYVGRRVTLAMSSLEVIRRHFRECTYFNKLWIDCAQPEFFNLSDFEAVFNAMMKTPVNPDYIRFEYRLRDTLFIGSFTEEVFVGLKTFRPDIAYARNASGFNRFKWKKGSNLTIEVCRYAVKSTLYFKFGKSMMSNT